MLKSFYYIFFLSAELTFKQEIKVGLFAKAVISI